jgi:hypothetical protein
MGLFGFRDSGPKSDPKPTLHSGPDQAAFVLATEKPKIRRSPSANDKKGVLASDKGGVLASDKKGRVGE